MRDTAMFRLRDEVWLAAIWVLIGVWIVAVLFRGTLQ